MYFSESIWYQSWGGGDNVFIISVYNVYFLKWYSINYRGKRYCVHNFYIQCIFLNWYDILFSYFLNWYGFNQREKDNVFIISMYNVHFWIGMVLIIGEKDNFYVQYHLTKFMMYWIFCSLRFISIIKTILLSVTF